MSEQNKLVCFKDEIAAATSRAMRENPKIVLFGLGVNDPGRVFGTTAGLVEEFGNERVFETPTSENAMTGVAIGAAIAGNPVVFTHQRFDFALLAMDQLVNAAAKWHFMFGGQFSVPITVRVIVGRGWGQGPTHSQDFSSWFRSVPGIKVVYPSMASEVGDLLRQSILDPNPVIFVEHRWLHGTIGEESDSLGPLEFGRANVARSGSDITLLSWGIGLVDCLKAASLLEHLGVSAEIVDARFLAPFDWETLEDSVRKTSKLLVVDSTPESGSFGMEVIGGMYSRVGAEMTVCKFLGSKGYPLPTSQALNADYFPNVRTISNSVCEILGVDLPAEHLFPEGPHDVPSSDFGPF